jgi:hypothetical protein
MSSKQIRYLFLLLGGRTRRLSESLLHFGQGGAVGLGLSTTARARRSAYPQIRG